MPDAAKSDRLYFLIALSQTLGAGVSRQALAITGKWVKHSGQVITVTAESLNQMIANFAKVENGEVNVDYDHASESPLLGVLGPSPSAGRITKLYALEPFGEPSSSGDRQVLYGDYEPTQKARELVEKKEYRYFSIASKTVPDLRTGKPQGWTLTSVALTNIPVIDELPQIMLSEGHEFLMDAQSVETPTTDPTSAIGGNKGEKKMAKLQLKRLASSDGTPADHGVFDGDQQVGTIGHQHLMDHAAACMGEEGGAAMSASTPMGAKVLEFKKKAGETAAAEARTALLSEIGAPGKTPAELKQMLATAANPPKPEALLLSETASADGLIDRAKLDALTDSGAVKPSAQRRALDAEARVDRAFRAGKILPANKKSALELCLSNEPAFKIFIEDATPAVDLEVRGATPAPGKGPDGKGPMTLAFEAAITKRMTDTKESYQLAEMNLVHTTEGLRLYEAARKEQLEPAKK